MVLRSRSIARPAAVAAALACAPAAVADGLPTVPGVIHLDPFVPGWLPVGAPFNAVVPAGGANVQMGADALASPAPHIDEYQLDFIGLVGVINVSMNGGPATPVVFGPGPDIYIINIHADFAGELGPVPRTLTNTGAGPVAWGVSVVEDPSNPNQQHGGSWSWPKPGGGTGSAPVPPPFGTLSNLYISRAPGVWNVTFTPPPPPCPGDANGDRRVNFTDLNIILSQFGQVGPGLFGDVNGDGRVDFADLNLALSNFGVNC